MIGSICRSIYGERVVMDGLCGSLDGLCVVVDGWWSFLIPFIGGVYGWLLGMMG